MERLGRPRHRREGGRLSEWEVSESNPRGSTLRLHSWMEAWLRPESLLGCVAALTKLPFARKDELVDDTIFPVSNFNTDGLIRAT
jgi:hypothetical protein